VLSDAVQIGKEKEGAVVESPAMQKEPKGGVEPLVGHDVAVSRAGAPTADQLEWVDAAESLPAVADPEEGADPVPTGPEGADPEPGEFTVPTGPVLGDHHEMGNRSPPPSRDSVGPCSSGSATESRDKGGEDAGVGG
jgi:hypothetical protein